MRETLRANYFTKANKFNLIRQKNISNDNYTVLVLNLEPCCFPAAGSLIPSNYGPDVRREDGG